MSDEAGPGTSVEWGVIRFDGVVVWGRMSEAEARDIAQGDRDIVRGVVCRTITRGEWCEVAT